jgi:hypothetical protein
VIKLTYFKKSGKWYSEGYMEWSGEDYDLYSQIRKLRYDQLPGLAGGWSDIIHISGTNNDGRSVIEQLIMP